MNTFLLYFTLITTFVVSCGSSNNSNSKIDQEICECIINGYEEIGVDIVEELNSFEKHLIEKGQLESNEGASYRKVFKQFANLKDSPIESDYIITAIDDDPEIQNNCLYNNAKIDMIKNDNSTFLKLHSALQNSNNSVSDLAQTISSTLSDRDFESDVIRLYSLFVFYKTKNFETKMNEKLPKKIK